MSDLQGIMQALRGVENRYAYSANAAAITTAATATDVVTLTGSATKTVRVHRVVVNGIATAATAVQVGLVKRSTANTGGTSAGLTEVPLNSQGPAASATGLSYTANPTPGTSVGTVALRRVLFGTSATEAPATVFDFGDWPVELRGTGEVLAVNLGGVTVTGGSLNADLFWTEE